MMYIARISKSVTTHICDEYLMSILLSAILLFITFVGYSVVRYSTHSNPEFYQDYLNHQVKAS